MPYGRRELVDDPLIDEPESVWQDQSGGQRCTGGDRIRCPLVGPLDGAALLRSAIGDGRRRAAAYPALIPVL
jgi:hypothetical protein